MYIVIEVFGGAEYAVIITNEDGTNKVFTSSQEANNEALACQDGIVVEI